uniref:Cytochrome c-553 n=1 Tax=Synura sphagnicola TaxID=52556 RepID=A0A3G2QYV6_9STRA|nr:cytochrome c6 [Synura sphagnicola]AYO28322.1 cytochrome c6 [Synura sphagnicola]
MNFFFYFLIIFSLLTESEVQKWDKGKVLFSQNCLPCHTGGNNIILPEKNLKKESLEANGMKNLKAITYQILNGKNGMPAFGGRLTESEIDAIALYVFEESDMDFKDIK